MTSKMTKYVAEKVLGLTGTYTYKDFQKAYRTAVKTNHPDAGGNTDAMVEINAAKDYLEDFFEDKNATVKASATDTAATGVKTSTANTTNTKTSTASTATASAAADFVKNAAAAAYATNGSEKDVPFTACNYTDKAQDAWTDEDWEAFKNFQPTAAYNTAEYAVEKMKSWSPVYIHLADAGNIDVSNWIDNDWYYYWFVNARNPRNDGKVYTRLTATPLTGPYAEKIRAKKSPNYYATAQAYWNNDTEWVNTPYGRVDASSFERMGWNGNVGVPWIYALCEDYELWLSMNLEAQKAAVVMYCETVKNLAASNYGWMGEEFANAGKSTTNNFAKKTVGYANAKTTTTATATDWDSDEDAPAWYDTAMNVAAHFPCRIVYWVLSAWYGCSTLAGNPTGGEYWICSILALLAFVNVIVPVLGFIPAMIRGVAKTALFTKKMGTMNAKKTG